MTRIFKLAALAALSFSTGSFAQDAPPLGNAILNAADACEQAMSGPIRMKYPAQVFMDTPAHLKAPSFADVPDLVKRFAATTTGGRLSSDQTFIRLASQEAAVWASVSNGFPFCDVAVISTEGLDRNLPAELVESLKADGWSLTKTLGVDDESAPLFHYSLAKAVPGKESATRILWIKGMNHPPQGEEGIHLELNMMQGTPTG